ncbi:hypothetical protein PCANC_08994 [Puccinia coronata f. sp. avenae]|uniref:Uncharacterized protein n=1 Tax=Puccinia coronata f. sp. avenae TaxID=200324 RepID=A0A2N5VHQ0_9BASI|nr:hypothetical protein PCANC_08994 [Puccinia coronata f. sp. avenae]
MWPLLAKRSRAAVGYLLARALAAVGYLLAKSSRAAVGHLLAESSWAAVGYLLAESSQAAALPALTGQTRQFERCSNSRVRPVVGQALFNRWSDRHCSTGGQTGTVRPKHLPAGQTGLSNQFLGPVAQHQPGPVGQSCPTSWLSLQLDSALTTTGRTRLFEHHSNCRV